MKGVSLENKKNEETHFCNRHPNEGKRGVVWWAIGQAKKLKLSSVSAGKRREKGERGTSKPKILEGGVERGGETALAGLFLCWGTRRQRKNHWSLKGGGGGDI